MKIRTTTAILAVILAIAATIRWLTGDTSDLYIVEEAHRYLWDFSLVFVAGYSTHALVDHIYKKWNEPNDDEHEEDA